MTNAYIYSLKAVLKLGPTDQQLDALTTQTLGALIVVTWKSRKKVDVLFRLKIFDFRQSQNLLEFEYCNKH